MILRPPRRLRTVASSGGESSLYAWYPALDLNTLPFNVGAGAYGAQVVVQTAGAPVITREVTVTSTSHFSDEAAIPGTRIIIGYSTSSDVLVQGSFTDLDVVVPPYRSLGALAIGNYAEGTVLRRVRVRGETVGQYSGGTVAALEFLSDIKEDYIVDGVGLLGGLITNSWYDGEGHTDYPTVQRAAIVNTRFHSEQAASLWYADHCVVAGNTTSTGRNYSPTEGEDESWCFRARGAPFIYFDNDFRGTKFHRIRHAPHYDRDGLADEYLYVGNNRLVDLHEARIFAGPFPDTLNAPTDTLAGVWFVGNEVYAENGTQQTTPNVEAVRVANFASITNNQFFGDITQSMLDGEYDRSQAAVKDFTTGNTFSAMQAIPAYGRAGDPEVLPLPYTVGTIVEENTGKPPGALGINVTWGATGGVDGYVLFGSYRDRGGLTDPSIYPMRYLAGSGATSQAIGSLSSGAKYFRVTPYTSGVFGTPGAQSTYTPA